MNHHYWIQWGILVSRLINHASENFITFVSTPELSLPELSILPQVVFIKQCSLGNEQLPFSKKSANQLFLLNVLKNMSIYRGKHTADERQQNQGLLI